MHRTCCWMALVILTASWTSEATASVKTEERGGRVNPTTARDWLPHASKDNYYTESWTTVIRSQSGRIIYVSLLTTNIGVFAGQAAVSVSDTAPGQKAKHYKWEYEPDKFGFDPGSGTIKVGLNSIALKGRDARLFIKEKEFSLDVSIKGWMDGVQFYFGRTDVDRKDNEWTATWFHVPRGDVSGSLTVGGKKESLNGDGYVDHMVQNVLGGDYSTRWWAVRHFAKDHTVVAIAFRAKKEAGGGLWLRVLVTDRTKVLLLTDKGKLTASKMGNDKDGYKYHKVFAVQAQEETVKLDGVFSGTKFHDRVSIMEELPWAQRQVAKMVAGNPIAYRLEGTGAVTLTVGGAAPVTLEGPALLETFVFEDAK